jgi:hypothetical protein
VSREDWDELAMKGNPVGFHAIIKEAINADSTFISGSWTRIV